MDVDFGSLRTRVSEELKDLFGSVQAGVSFEDGEFSGGVTVGERRWLSATMLALALVVGILAGAAFFGGRK